MAVIEVEDLVVRYGERIAVDHLSLSIAEGELLCVLGRNGAGKTSTIESMEGLRPHEGRVTILGLDARTQREALSRSVGVMLQGGGPYQTLNARRALRLEASYYESALDVEELLEKVGLSAVAHTAAKRLSGGERRRLALALALVGKPRVLFLDEPTSGVDAHGRIEMRNLLHDLRRDGVTILVTTHELDEAERIADRICILHAGHVAADGSFEQLTSGGDSISLITGPGVDLTELTNLASAVVEQSGENSFRILASPTPELMASLSSYLASRQIALFELRPDRSSLEDVFVRLTGETPQ